MTKRKEWKYTSYNAPVVRDADIEAFALRQLSDYQKDYFFEPRPLDVDDFVENQLGIKVSYHRLSKNKSIFGVTALTDTVLPVMGSDGKTFLMAIQKGDIVIDSDACNNRESSIRFTLMHEAAHSQFDKNINAALLKRTEFLYETHQNVHDSGLHKGRRSPQDWMEHHADRYATYILMPKPFVRALWKVYRQEFFPNQRITPSRTNRLWCVIAKIADKLQVAKISIAYRLRELNLISEKVFDSLGVRQSEVAP